MSRVRIGITPGAWRVEDPATPHRSPGSAHVPAENVGSMRPIVQYGGLMLKAPSQPAHPWGVEVSVPKSRPTPICRVTMPITGERCARTLGHLDSHRSRRIMDADAHRRHRRYVGLA